MEIFAPPTELSGEPCSVHLARAYSNCPDLLERLQEVLGKVEKVPLKARYLRES